MRCSPLALSHHDFCDEIHNGASRLLGVELGEHVARVVGPRRRFPSDEAENSRLSHVHRRQLCHIVVVPSKKTLN